MIDPAGIPQITGDTDALAGHATAVAGVGTDFADTGQRVDSTWQELAEVYKAPEAAQLLAATAPVRTVSASVGEDLTAVGSALSTYATTVAGIKTRLEALRADATTFVGSVSGDDDWRSDESRVNEHDQLLTDVNAAVADFTDAQRTCANTILALYTEPRWVADDGDGEVDENEFGYSAEMLDAALGAENATLGGENGALAWGNAQEPDRGFLGDIDAFLDDIDHNVERFDAGLITTIFGGQVVNNAAANAAWWTALTPAAQKWVLKEKPERVGNVDGVPAWARDKANRALLYQELRRNEVELAVQTVARNTGPQPDVLRLNLPRDPALYLYAGPIQDLTPDQIAAQERINQLTAQRAALTAVEATLIGKEGRSLLLLDMDGHSQPRAAVAVGDIDTADHVSVFTPGFNTTVADDLGKHVKNMEALRGTALEELQEVGRGDQTVATVAWIGYDAPQLGTVLQPSESTLLPHAARDGGRELAAFLSGITASRPDDPHLTALGHSYGSTTTAYALQNATGVDDVVLFGSPGAPSVDIEVPDEHVAVLEAGDDHVADIGVFGGDPSWVKPYVELSANGAFDTGWTVLRKSWGHSEYLTPGTTSHLNLAYTIAGLHGRRILAGSTGLGDFAPDVEACLE